MNYILYLDDERSPENDAEVMKMLFSKARLNEVQDPQILVARSFYDFESIIHSYGLPYFISFDHDLGIEETEFGQQELNGETCVRWLIEYCHANLEPLPEYRFHSENYEGRKTMHSLLQSAMKSGYVIARKTDAE